VLDVQLGQIDAQIGMLESVIEEREAELLRLDDAISRTPLNAITLGGLQRDYENIRVQYDSAVARLAQASTGERIELTSRGQRITLIEAANVPRRARASQPQADRRGRRGGRHRSGRRASSSCWSCSTARSAARSRSPATSGSSRWRRSPTFHQVRAAEALRRPDRGDAPGARGLPAALWAIDTYYIPLDQLATEALPGWGWPERLER
jgi:hypothetical protein